MMILLSSTLVLVGAWNRAVLSPAWIAREAFELGDEDVPVELSFESTDFTNPNILMRNLRFRVVNGRMSINSSTWDEPTLREIERITNNIVTKLPHTPISAIGENFHLRFDNPGVDVLSRFSVRDNLADYFPDGRNTATKIVKSISIANDWVLNLSESLSTENGAVTIEFNFHHACSGSQEASRLLESDSFAKHRGEAIAIIASEYDTNEDSIEYMPGGSENAST